MAPNAIFVLGVIFLGIEFSLLLGFLPRVRFQRFDGLRMEGLIPGFALAFMAVVAFLPALKRWLTRTCSSLHETHHRYGHRAKNEMSHGISFPAGGRFDCLTRLSAFQLNAVQVLKNRLAFPSAPPPEIGTA